MKIDRLLGILTVLLRDDRVTAPYLAEKFEVTRRTISRDVDALCQAGIPIVTRQGGGGGISIAEGYKLDKSVLTAGELSDIVAAIRGIGSVSGEAQLEKTLDKLSASKDAVLSLREPIMVDLASHYKGSLTLKIQQIKQAILQQKMIRFDYYYKKGCVPRCIEPYLVLFQWTAWYVFGFCPERQDWRMFKLTRLWNLNLSEQAFTPREVPPEKRDFNAHLPDDKNLIALFDPSARYQLIEAYGLHCFTETDQGMLRFELGYTNREYIISWLLGFGSTVRVLEPKDIAEDICRTAQKILEKYF